MTLRRLIDGNVQDSEAIANFTDARLASNLKLGMVLDASYSMTQWDPPAFTPMKQSALDTLDGVRRQFASWNSGAFSPALLWFQDQYLCEPSSPTMPDRAVLDIPAPAQGSSTKLYAAAARMVDELQAAATPNPNATDQFAMVLFTDGKDNYSQFDTSSVPAKSFPATGGSFTCTGAAPVTLEALLAKLNAFEGLRVYVIGLGNQLDATVLGAIARAGNGRFVSNPDSGSVASLFGEIQREFTTVRRDGITTPIADGEHTYVEEVSSNGNVSRVTFRFRVANGTATVLQDTVKVD